MAKFAVVLPAAGKSRRFKDEYHKKPFALLDNRAVWLHAADKFINRDDVIQTIVVIAAEDREMFELKFAPNVAVLGIEVVDGGVERVDSVAAALERVKPEADFVCIHDAARPCVAETWIDRVFDMAKKTDAAILAIPVAGTLKRVDADERIVETVSRRDLWEAQTPQVFRRQLLLDAYVARQGNAPTDDAQLVEQFGHPVAIVRGSPINFKITTTEDLRLATHAIRALPETGLPGPIHPFSDKW